MASPVWVQSSEISAMANSIQVTKPPGTLENHVLLLWVYWESNAAVTITPPASFVEVAVCAGDNTSPNPDIHVRLYWKRATASEGANYTVGLSASVSVAVHIAAFSGCVTTATPVEVGNKVTSAQNLTLPSLTALTIETLIVGFAASFEWANTWSSAVLTERWDTATQGQALYATAQAGTGATGTKALTQSGSGQAIGTICLLASQAQAVTATSLAPRTIARRNTHMLIR